MIKRPTTTALVILAALVAVACSGTEGGLAPSTAPTAVDPGSPLPPRPRELRLSGLEPCAVFTPSQRSQLGVADGSPGTASDGLNSPGCLWKRFPKEPRDSYLLQLVTGRGAEYALASETGSRVIDIGGFAAVETRRDPRYPVEFHCVLLVDVAAGQNLWVQYDYDGSTVPMTRELACEKARVAAEMAVQTLIDQAGG